MVVSNPLVSCLCVTENRPAFMPWLLWCFERQSWSRRELVIVDSSAEPYRIAKRDDVRIVTVPPGTGIGRKRNIALQEARGEIITWFDDDDWQHPSKLVWLVEALKKGAPYAGSCQGWFIDLMELRCVPYRSPKRRLLFNGAGFRREVVVSFSFSETLEKASDTRWMRDLATRFSGRAVTLEQEVLFCWLCHEANHSNPAKCGHFPHQLEALKKLVEIDAWGDTDEALKRLRLRLTSERPSKAMAFYPKRRSAGSSARMTKRQAKSMVESVRSNTPVEREHPQVGLIIKATVMDAPFLDVMVRHMISQSRYSFAERTIIVDRQPAFTGKYRTRPRASQDELDQVLEQLLSDGTVDRVDDVDTNPILVKRIMEHYFGKDAHRVSLHAVSGGPIYATLFGLESVTTDYVLQMDADIFFYSSAHSWVQQALECLTADPLLWLMMTHPGPPAGPVGVSLGKRNARCATWDERFQIWRFKHATTRYFLCDRRRLHDRLRFVAAKQGCAPLEQCISEALKRHGTFRGALGDLKSWHIHAWFHGAPFPTWALSLAKAIEAGYFPAAQRGNYDLRLDRTQNRQQWSELLKRVEGNEPASLESARSVPLGKAPNSCMEEAGSSILEPDGVFEGERRERNFENLVDNLLYAKCVSERKPYGAAPLAVVIPIRNRAGQRLKNALRSLNWQSAGRPSQILIVSHGSHPNINEELSSLCSEENATLIRIGDPAQPWNKSLALNVGIRATRRDVPYIVTMDADIMLAPNFFVVLMGRLTKQPPTLVLCRISDLPQSVSIPADAKTLMDEFYSLHAMTRLRSSAGTGGIQAASRSFFFKIRGYDEDLVWWGAMDGDMVLRARLAQLEITWIENQTTMLHQWHPRKYRALTHPREIQQARRAWRRNHALVRSRSRTLKRNPNGWGGVIE